MWAIIFFLFISITFGKDVCLKLSNDSGEDSYITQRIYYLLKTTLLEAGYRLSCSEKAQNIYVSISYTERPISLSQKQRVSTYILNLSLRVNDREFYSSIPYSVNPSLGELPRRRAAEELFGRIKLNILEYFIELKKHAGNTEGD